jgi:hypothetical protein
MNRKKNGAAQTVHPHMQGLEQGIKPKRPAGDGYRRQVKTKIVHLPGGGFGGGQSLPSDSVAALPTR